MRRSVLQKSENVCVFCAVRYGTLSSARPSGSLEHVRAFTSKTELHRPGAAQAVAREDDDEPSTLSIRYGSGNTNNQWGSYSRVPPPAPQPYQRPRDDPGRKMSDSLVRPVQSQARGSLYRLNERNSVVSTRNSRQGPSDRLPDNPTARPLQTRRPPPTLTGFEAFEKAARETRRPPETRKPQGPTPQFESQPRKLQDLAKDVTGGIQWQPGRLQGLPNRLQSHHPRSPASSFQISSGRQILPHADVPPPEVVVDEDDMPFQHHRRIDRRSQTQTERRNQRFGMDEDDTTTPSLDNKKNYSNGKPRITQADDELEAIEEEFYGAVRSKRKRKAKKVGPPSRPLRPQLEIPDYISVQNLAKALHVKVDTFVERLEEEGYEGARYDHILDAPTSSMFAEVYGFEPVMPEAAGGADLVARPPAEDRSLLPPRPPIVTIMGHVDHGKTTILDWLRKSSVVETEHGGITQHIGAFSVTMPGTKRPITFLDTPGHAAFLDMRKRGAIVTDIVVLVVAADDGVKPQTIEAIKHATEANVQIIVAINKIDKEDSNVEKVWQELGREGIYVENYGGDTQAIPLSGKTGQGMEALEEAIITLADVSDFRAERDGPAEGWIIESKVTSGGRVATVLVRRGTLRPGNFIVAGNTWARVRTLRNDAGQLVSEARPGTPVQVDGWRGEDPTAGLEVLQAEDEEHAKDVVAIRMEQTENVRAAADTVAINQAKSEHAEARSKVMAWRKEQGLAGRLWRRRHRENVEFVDSATNSGPRRVPFVIKADVAGSAEAIAAAVSAIGNNEVAADVIHSGTGHLSESDIKLLATTGEVGYAISFNQPVDATIYRLAEAADLQILDHNIIYKVTDDVTAKLSDELAPLITQRVLGEAEVGQIFEINIKRKKLKVAGCRVTNGAISKAQKIRVLRGKEVIYTGTLDSLKNVKKDVTEMRKGSECGMSFENWEDFREGDQIQSFEEITEKRKLY